MAKHRINDDFTNVETEISPTSNSFKQTFTDIIRHSTKDGEYVIESLHAETLSQRRLRNEKERKIGHRRVGEGGEITYKKIQTSQIMGSIQLGIQHTVGSLASKPKRDLLMMDFWEVESITFPPEGSSLTPAHHHSEFRYKIYAPIAFRYFRDLFGIQPDDFMMSMCSSPLTELSNPGASGSIFYLTNDDEFIIKTVQHKEGEFLQKLLPGYYMNLNQNPRTLLPKFFGLYCLQTSNGKNIRMVVMNNLLPSYVNMHLKYDLKGSTFKRKASKAERAKKSPTFKDLDFLEHHPNGIFLEAETYSALIKTIQRDCTVLESFKIMDYSLLVGVHNLDLSSKEKQTMRNMPPPPSSSAPTSAKSAKSATTTGSNYNYDSDADEGVLKTNLQNVDNNSDDDCQSNLQRHRSNRQRLVAHSTALESIQAESEPIDVEDDMPPGGIPARSEKGERLLLFIGIIDILQSYRLKKKLEHTVKSIIHDGETVSVCRPSFYAQRFQNFMAKTVFRKIPSLDLPEIKGNHRKFRTLVTSYIALKHSPSKRKNLAKTNTQQRSIDNGNNNGTTEATVGHSHSLKKSHNGVSGTMKAANSSATANNTTGTELPTAGDKPLAAPPSTKQRLHKTKLAVSGNVKNKIPPPVPPRGSPRKRDLDASQGLETSSPRTLSTPGTTPSCSSTPPPAFDDISEHNYNRHSSSSISRRLPQHSFGQQSGSLSSASNYESKMNIGPAYRGSSTASHKDEPISFSDAHLDSYLGVDTTTSASSQYSSRGGLAWTPPASGEGSTPTWTEGTPSFTDSSSSEEFVHFSPINSAKMDRYKLTVEEAINSLSSEMIN